MGQYASDYFAVSYPLLRVSYLLISFGIALSNRCGLPIIPTDLFPRELAQITKIAYSKIKISFDVICLAATAGMTGLFLGHLSGLGAGTILAAFTMSKMVGIMGKWLDSRFCFLSFLNHRKKVVCSPGKFGHTTP